MKSSLTKALAAAGVLASLGFAASPAMAALYNPFTVDEGSVPGANPALISNAGRITGGYSEVITFNATTATQGTFAASIKWNAGQFLDTSAAGNPLTNQLGSSTANQYMMYALVLATGNYTISGSATTFTPDANVGSLSLWIDPSSNTTFTAPSNGGTPWTLGNNGEDYQLASGVITGGSGYLNPALLCPGGSTINCGSFGTNTSFNLTAAGKQYFTIPSPFYNVSLQSGQLNNFAIGGTQTINGSMDVVFKTVPEPASLALVGLGLLGMGVSLRRRKQS